MEKKADKRFLFYIGAMVVLGLAILSTASAPVGYQKFQDSFYFVKMQFIKGLLPGFLLLLIFSKINYERLQKLAWPFYIFVIFLLCLVFIPGIGLEINNARSWVDLGVINFQPSEFVKVAFIILLAFLLSNKNINLADWKHGLLPILAIISPAFFLVLMQPDIGTLSILALILFFMLYLAKVPKIFLFILALLGIIAFSVMILIAPYRLERLNTFLHPELDPQGIGYHVNQSFLAIGSGGFWGLGLGHSRQKYQYLPEVSSDSIFAVVGEEAGFLGASALIFLFFVISHRGLKIAKSAPDQFGRLLVGGVIIWIMGQAFLNIGAMVGLLPLTGVPLPFISHGGSALLAVLSGVGIVLSVSKQTKIE